ncbi:MAG: sorbitol-6-phosphate dehydrogenase subunit [Fibrobacteria bacterium]|jgi:sorbitol-6-phosphate 2-dehydrogenase
MSWLGLEKKVVVVTGGASGIGKACCESFASNGAHVVIADLDKVSGEAMALRLTKEYGPAALFRLTDVTKPADAAGLIADTVAKFGRVDAIVNNAGINIPRLLADPQGKQELSEDIWDKMMAINLKGVYLCAQQAAKAMTAAGVNGVIINMASESGMEGSEGQSGYSATKAAMYGLTRSWAKELGKRGVRVVGVAPGILEATGLRSESYENALAYTRNITVDKLRSGYVATTSIPLGRAGRLSEVADLVTYLASDRASYIHGTVINISGGKSRE